MQRAPGNEDGDWESKSIRAKLRAKPMDPEAIHEFCNSLPHTTSNVQWGADLVFRVGQKIYAVMNVEPDAGHVLSFKCTPETFEELLERDGVVPAPYMARNKWVALERFDAIPARELQTLIRTSYDLVYAKLPKRLRNELESADPPSS